jgi:hypothetical protein
MLAMVGVVMRAGRDHRRFAGKGIGVRFAAVALPATLVVPAVGWPRRHEVPYPAGVDALYVSLFTLDLAAWPCTTSNTPRKALSKVLSISLSGMNPGTDARRSPSRFGCSSAGPSGSPIQTGTPITYSFWRDARPGSLLRGAGVGSERRSHS